MKKFKRFILVFLTVVLPGFAFSQPIAILEQANPSNPLEIEEYTLPNGLRVYLNPDHTQTSVFGAVVVKGGSKRDPKEATGIAHYLEHMMFKGTNEIGTVNFEEEKIYLDSITLMYDLLGKTSIKEERTSIQKTINRLSLKAANYAIPGELDRILNGIGSTNLNAFTSEENIVYFNMFPAAHIEKWIEIYSHRFENPVFRLFQSELETVYEEKNMYSDNSFFTLLETYLKNFYRKSPYGQQTVLGSIEHLKNPSLTKMYEYFNTYYVANNMALILSGDFDAMAIKPIIAAKFGTWRQGKIPTLPDFREEPFKGREQVNVRLTPIKIGILGFRTFPKAHPDGPVFDVMSQLLSNGASTGLLDKLYVDNKIMGAGMFNQQYDENGGAILFFVPKIVGQSIGSAEKIVLAEFEKLKKGEFSDETLESAKLNLRKQQIQEIERPMGRGMAIIDAFNMNMSWSKYLDYQAQVNSVTKKDIQRVTSTYFGENYMALQSKTGFPKKEKLAKPPYDPVTPANSEASSQFTEKLKAVPSHEIPARFIDFKTDLQFQDFPNGNSIYYAQNPINELFNLQIRFGVGTEKMRELEPAQAILDMAYPADMTYEEFKEALNKIGTSIDLGVSDDYLTITISGFDNKLEESMVLAGKLISQPVVDKKHHKKITEMQKATIKAEKKEPSIKGTALFEYALYKNESAFLQRYSGKELKTISTDSLMLATKKAFSYQADIFYSGTIDYQKVIEYLPKLQMSEQTLVSESPLEKKRETYGETIIYLMNDPKAVQSQIHVFVEGSEIPPTEIPLAHSFNEYFGGGMSSIVFQEIREFRSLAYTAHASFNTPFYMQNLGYLSGYMSTQADKTIEALTVFTGLIKDMPQKEERLENVKSSLIETTHNSKAGFRNVGSTVARFRKKGFNEDPRKSYLSVYENLSFHQIVDFYSQHIANRPMVICIVTDLKRINMEELKTFGKIIEVKHSTIFKD